MKRGFARLVMVLAFGLATFHASTARADDAAHQKAIDLFHRGGEAYRAGHFQEAIDLLKQAYEIEHDPTLLYNLARAYENLGDLDNAVATYNAYLRDVSDIKDRPAIEAKVATLQKEIDDKATLSKERDDALARANHPDTTKPPPDADVPRARRPVSPVPWIIAGVGVAGIAAGAGVGAAALSKNDAATKAASQKITRRRVTTARSRSRSARRSRSSPAAWSQALGSSGASSTS